MGRNSKAQLRIITIRREQVARLSLRGMTQREIAEGMTRLDPPIVGAEGKAFDVATINRDLKVLSALWRERASEDIAERKSKQLAEISEAKRRAWTDGDLMALARFIKLESDIFGTNAPSKVEVYDWRERAKRELGYTDVELDQLQDQFRAAVAAGRDRLVQPTVGTNGHRPD